MQSQEDDVKELYEASYRGDIAALCMLIQRDPLILDRISVSSFSETPLHVSCLLENVDFAKALLCRKPKLADELDSRGQSPLHLAAADGNSEIVKALLSINTDVCLVADQHGRLPLHLAAMRGRVEVIQQLITACFESAQAKVIKGRVLHSCVKYNHLESLKLFVTLLRNDGEIMNSVDNDGNTILGLAVITKQIEMMKYLLSIPEVKVKADAFSITCETYPIHFQDQLSDGNSNMGSGGDWLEKSRGNLMVVATVIAAMAFQAAINPPGGVWGTDGTDCSKGFRTCKAGTSILAYTNRTRYHQFILNNTISFCASLTTIILLIGGIPLKRKGYIWILLMVMCVTLFFTAATYVVTIAAIKAPVMKQLIIFLRSTHVFGLLCLRFSLHFIQLSSCFARSRNCLPVLSTE